jgi:hypothetical protein
MSQWQIRWGEGDRRSVATLAELDAVLDELGQASELILVEVVSPNGSSLAICLGGSETFLNYVPADRDPPYLSSVGDQDAEGTIEFQFSGEWSECPRRHVVPIASGRDAVRHFFQTSELSSSILWEED